MKPTTKLSGFKEVDQVLARLPKATGKRILRKTGIDALTPIAEDMRVRARERLGDLKEGITVGTKLSRSQRAFSGFNGGFKDPNVVVVHAGPGTHPQAITEEFGTFKQEAHPFVTPSWEAGKMGALDHVADTLGDVVMKAAARAKKKGKLR